MNKSELIESIAKKAGLTKDAAAKAVNAYTETVVETLKAGDKLMLAENELRKLEESEEDSGESKDSDKNDVVLNEALNILSDYITATGGGDVPMETEGDLRTRMMRIFGE